MTTKHYSEYRKFREEAIKEFFGNEGKVVYSTVMWNSKKKKYYLYEVTENAVLIVKAIDQDLIITKMLARPSRILKVWADAPQAIITIAIENSRNSKRFAQQIF